MKPRDISVLVMILLVIVVIWSFPKIDSSETVSSSVFLINGSQDLVFSIFGDSNISAVRVYLVYDLEKEVVETGIKAEGEAG